jgi:molybdopterin biosynthesis enzyme MoaB
VAEAIRAAGVAKGVPTAVLSRGIAGQAERTLVSTPRLHRWCNALEVAAVIPHALDQSFGPHPLRVGIRR